MVKLLYINLLTQKVKLSPQRDSHLMVIVLFEAITEFANLKRLHLSKFHNLSIQSILIRIFFINVALRKKCFS